MAVQPCTVGDMQLYVDGQNREMRTYIDGQNQALRAYVDGRDFLTVDRANTQIEKHLSESRYVTLHDLRGEGYAPAKEVKEDLISVVQRENKFSEEVKEKMQQLFDQTQSLQTGFEEQAKAATVNIEAIQAQMMTTFEQRSTQLQEHVDASQIANIAILELLKVQLNDYTNTKQAELLSHCEGRLHQLYDTVIKDAEAKLQQRIGEIQSTGGAGGEVPFGKGAPRERALFDPRDYKIPELVSDPS